MNDAEPIPEEMLTAYLDGELSETEAICVEQQLQRDDELRQTLSELRQIRDQIKRLPQHSLSSDFADRVTRQIAGQARSNQESEQRVATRRSQPNLPATVQRNRFRLAGVFAGIAALMLLSALGIKYLPSPNVAMNVREPSSDAASKPAHESQAGMGGLSDSRGSTAAAFDSGAIPIESTSEAEESIASLSKDVEHLAESDNSEQLALKNVSYGLVAVYRVSTRQLAALSQSWKKKDNVTEASPNQSDFAAFEFEGSFEEVSDLLGAVQAQASNIEGPSLNEFAQRGLSLYGRQRARRIVEVPETYNAATESPAALVTGEGQQRSNAQELPVLPANKATLVRRRQANADLAQVPGRERSATFVLKQDVVEGVAAEQVDADADEEKVELKKADENPPTVRILVQFKVIE